MRVKIKAKEYGIPEFEFGKRYYLAYAGITAADVFVFTRKNRIEMCDYNHERKTSSYWISKRKLKQLLKAGVIHFIAEAEESKG